MKIYLNGLIEWGVLLFLSAMVILAPIALTKHWRGSSPWADAGASFMGGFWYGSAKFRRGHVRATPVVLAVAFTLSLFGLWLFVIPPVPPRQVDFYASWGLVAALTVIVPSIVLYWMIVLFNAPKTLVAPRLRSQPGLIRERRLRREGRILSGSADDLRTQKDNVMASFTVTPSYAMVEIGDRDAKEVPQWGAAASERVVWNDSMVLVATRSDREGDVHITVLSSSEPPAHSHQVFAGELALPSRILAVGNSLAGQIKKIDLSPASMARVRVYVDALRQPGCVTVLISTDSG